MLDHDPMTAAFDYGEMRRVQLIMRRQQLSFRCEQKGVEEPACWQSGMDESEWCEPCRLRQPIYRDWRMWLKKEQKALSRLQRCLVRAFEGR